MIAPKFLDGYVWGVRVEHRPFIDYGFFDEGSLIHSDRTQYTQWNGMCWSIQIHRSEGRASKRALSMNLASECRVTLIGPQQIALLKYARTTNGAVDELLRTGDIAAFKSKCEDYHRDDPKG